MIIGALSNVERAQVFALLKNYDQIAEVINARLAYKTYRVVIQHDEKLLN